jgi:hypothetical protein
LLIQRVLDTSSPSPDHPGLAVVSIWGPHPQRHRGDQCHDPARGPGGPIERAAIREMRTSTRLVRGLRHADHLRHMLPTSWRRI